jgi:hypothetical protein
MITGRIYVMTDFFMYYYGSTLYELHERKSSHKSNNKIMPVQMYFNSVGWDKAHMILIEQGQFESINALRRREGEIIKFHHGKEYCLNRQIPNPTPEKSFNDAFSKACTRVRKLTHRRKARQS